VKQVLRENAKVQFGIEIAQTISVEESMAEFVKVATTDQLTPGQGMTVQVNGEYVALFNVDGTFYAIDDTCPHAGGPLGQGVLEDCVVTCPWHGWRFNVTTGVSPVVSSISVKKYEVKVEGNDVLVAVGER
jgi:nitrite reductase (NADH) small subunit/3-phenylpropionate/trans-cinnamate dioxygenase ferredoxin subunit